MTAIPTGARAARLDRLATTTGQFAILALDHTRSFATTLRPLDPDSLTPDEMLGTKARLIDGLASDASAILIDPALATTRRGAGTGPMSAGLIVGIEDGDYADAAAAPRLLPGWTVERAAELGADAVKISFSFDPTGDVALAVRFVSEVVRQCERADMPLFCEPLALRRERSLVRKDVIEGVRRFGELGADVLKIQFPADTNLDPSPAALADACAEVEALCVTPWALLSEGRQFDEFRVLLQIACQAGASGFLAGRAIWGESGVTGDGVGAASDRLTALRSIAIEAGRPWRRNGTTAGAATGGGSAPRISDSRSVEIDAPTTGEA